MDDLSNPTRTSGIDNGPAGQTHTAALGAPIASSSLSADRPDPDGNPPSKNVPLPGSGATVTYSSGDMTGSSGGPGSPGFDPIGRGQGGLVSGRTVRRPTLGRMVHYRLTADQARHINNRRAHSDAHRSTHRAVANGTVIHVGNTASEGRMLPMVIVGVHGDSPESAVNGQVFLDGNDTLWVTSVVEGDQPGNYCWPQRD